MKHKAISEKQPWAYLLCSGIKKIENRTWKLPEKYKGEWVLIHASTRIGRPTSELLTGKQLSIVHSLPDKEKFGFFNGRQIEHAIIGAVKFADRVINHPSIWAEKTQPVDFDEFTFPIYEKKVYNWVVSDAILFGKPILNVKGKLGFWDYPAEMIICPECGKICLHSGEGISRYVHNCEHCGFWITESDYEVFK